MLISILLPQQADYQNELYEKEPRSFLTSSLHFGFVLWFGLWGFYHRDEAVYKTSRI